MPALPSDMDSDDPQQDVHDEDREEDEDDDDVVEEGVRDELAEVSNDVVEDAPSDEVEEEGEGEDLLDDNAMDDYRAIDALDRYDDRDLDDTEYAPIDEGARRAAERKLRKRDQETMRAATRLGHGGIAALDFSDEDEEPKRQRRRIMESGDPNLVPDEALISEQLSASIIASEDQTLNIDNYKGQLKDWLSVDKTRQEVKRRFRLFLMKPKEDGEKSVYLHVIINMCTANSQSLPISYIDLSLHLPTLAIWLADEPEALLHIFNEVAAEVVQTIFPRYIHVHSDIHVRIKDLPVVDPLRDLRQFHLNGLVKVEGVVTRRSAVFPQLKSCKYNCRACGSLVGPFIQSDEKEVLLPTRCPHCQRDASFVLNSLETLYRNYQKITLQEAPGTVPAGRVPRQKECILLHDLIDTVSPGELVEVTGIYKHAYDRLLNTANGFPVFHTVILANFVAKGGESELSSSRLTEEDVVAIQQLSKDPNIAARIFASIGPSVYGHESSKIAIAMSLFGGTAKEFENGHRIRGDINVLMLGDPGTAKSQFLKYVEKTASRAVYTTGKGASAVGLTASVHRDALTREWVLEGGALVLADNGVCCIDEFDKMNEKDRTSIHEAMEQQSISISKAGIITTLKARCSVIAAANPLTGRYNSSVPFHENVQLTDAILSRFDVLCVVRDTVDRDLDRQLAEFVVDSHARASNSAEGQTSLPAPSLSTLSIGSTLPKVDAIPQPLLRKYIQYARTNFRPTLRGVDDAKLTRLYADLRRESSSSGGMPIAVRHMESIIRMSEAHAKMHLRDHVIQEDVNMASRVLLESFISSQKYSVMRSLRRVFDKYLSYAKDREQMCLWAVQQLVNDELLARQLQRRSRRRAGDDEEDDDTIDDPLQEEPVRLRIDEIEDKTKEIGVSRSQLESFFQSELFKQNQFEVEGKSRYVVKRFNLLSR